MGNSVMAEVNELENRMVIALHTTWQTIGEDILSATTNNTIKQKDVCEIILDANYLETYGGNDNKEAIETFRKLSHQGQRMILNKAFKYKFYGR